MENTQFSHDDSSDADETVDILGDSSAGQHNQTFQILDFDPDNE